MGGPAFPVVEATIDGVHDALLRGQLTVRALVEGYLVRIEACDRAGPALNAILAVNPGALAEADRLDAEHAMSGRLTGPLHGVPLLVKDQVETAGMETTFGSIALQGYVPGEDATVIARLRAAGAIVLAKTTLPDFATSWFSFSSVSGTTRNPYDLERDPGGSSSGTGAGVAASLGLAGIGADTGGSIRVPAAFSSLVGLRVTTGLISRHGVSALVEFLDTAGPMTRTVRDAALLLDAMVGYDSADAYTSACLVARPPVSYAALLDAGALEGARIGVLRQVFGDPADLECAAVNAVIENALGVMQGAGATVVDVELPGLDAFMADTSLFLTHSRHDLDRFLSARPALPYTAIGDIVRDGRYHPALEWLRTMSEGPASPSDDPDYYRKMAARETFQRAVVNAMAEAGVAVLAYPSVQVVAPTRADLEVGRWTVEAFPTNTMIASQAGLPAISVPAGATPAGATQAGATPAGLPVGLELLAPPYGEPTLLGLAHAFEQAAHARVVPGSTPEL
jgi:Asp-tRNA(Asn)/Glu-tRNA(Gln) amidotransferase A subunit family amidase